jgi:hypothetical protein
MRDRKEHRVHRNSTKARWAAIAAAMGIVISVSATASADNEPPPPPPGFEGQPGQPAPPGYAPQPGYGQPPPPGGYYGGPGYAPSALGPKILDWEEGDPVRPGYHPDTRVRRGLVIGGAVTFGVTYLLTALVGAVAADVNELTNSSRSDAVPLFIPVIGPFIAIGTLHAGTTGGFFLALDGIAQAGGVAMFVAGLASPRTVQVRNDISKPFVRPTPMMVGGTSPGFGLVGKF